MKQLITAHNFFVHESKTFITPSLFKYIYYPVAYVRFMLAAIKYLLKYKYA